ncbi:MAG TPA: enoyl-CoA hydratase/isomerase family protein [Ferrovibrio sp.]|jgi:enoyl-CoA hydratase/carnithine racemase|uniref:enoyl-CoA hydratase/isomerase family protein n=1 Tax=Ferrovibrio sp. TaxID=1917215 RepID=UPI002ED0D02C
MSNAVHYHVRDGIAEILLDSPPVNALTIAMLEQVIAGFRRAAADDAVRAVVLSSAVPRRFCAGLDLSNLLGAPEAEIRRLLNALYIELSDAQHALGKPSVAAITGAARGGGMTIAISCDVLLAAESASFGYPEIDIAVLPAIHFAHLPRIVGRHRAFELLFTGRSFDAAEAAALGLVSHVYPDAELHDRAHALARTFAAKPPQAMRAAREAFLHANDAGYRLSIRKAVDDFCRIATGREAQEGLGAFLAKRKPRW